MRNWRLSTLARAFGNHLVQAPCFADEGPQTQRGQGTARDHTLGWWRSRPPRLAFSTTSCNI